MTPAWMNALATAIVFAGGAAFGWSLRVAFARKPPHTPSSPDGHLFRVTRAQPFPKPATMLRNPYAGEVVTTAEQSGTLLLMRCPCGAVKTEWVPGNWAASDFEATAPMDMDRALDALTKQEKP